jgi:hypothetical protein
VEINRSYFWRFFSCTIYYTEDSWLDINSEAYLKSLTVAIS